MAGTVSGGRQAAATNKKLYGANFYKTIGRLGGLTSMGGGFASEKVGDDGLTGRERAGIVGAEGGKASRRKKAYDKKKKSWVAA